MLIQTASDFGDQSRRHQRHSSKEFDRVDIRRSAPLFVCCRANRTGTRERAPDLHVAHLTFLGRTTSIKNAQSTKKPFSRKNRRCCAKSKPLFAETSITETMFAFATFALAIGNFASSFLFICLAACCMVFCASVVLQKLELLFARSVDWNFFFHFCPV